MRTGRFTKQEIAFVAKSKLTVNTIARKLNRTIESVNKYKSLATPANTATSMLVAKPLAKTTLKPTAKKAVIVAKKRK